MQVRTSRRPAPSRRSRPFRLLPACVLAATLLGAQCLSLAHAGDNDAPKNPYANDKAAAAKGEELFGRNCQQCHNTRGKGGKGPQLIRGAWGPGGANSDDYMYGVIAGGRPGTEMGAFALSLSQEEIWDIITFLREEAKRAKAADAEQKKKGADSDLWY